MLASPIKTQFLRIKNKPTSGFTLMETVIAILVVGILLTGFLAVFTPAAKGIKKSINSQQADRLTSTLERELVTVRANEQKDPADDASEGYATGFDKAFDWISEGHQTATAIFVYQYRGDRISDPRSEDGSLLPVTTAVGQPGKDYSIQSTARRADDPLLEEDLAAVEGDVFYVKPIQLIYQENPVGSGDYALTRGEEGEIRNPSPLPVRTPDPFEEVADSTENYSEAIITFAVEFYSVPSKSINYLTGAAFDEKFTDSENEFKPIFVRNIAIRR